MNFLGASGNRIFYRLDGPAQRSQDAPVIVLINSLGTNLHMWDPQLEPFSRRMTVVRYDQRGHGESETPATPATIELLGSDLLALVDRLGLERVHLCGLSLGGLTAQWFAARHPERVDRLIFANTAARIGSSDGWDARIAAVRSGGMASIRAIVVNRFLSSQFRERRPEIAHGIGDMVEATDPDGYCAACTALREADLHPILNGIHSPTLVIASEWDESTPPDQGRELHEAIPGSEFVLMKEAAHLSNVEQSESFSDLVTEFLGRRSPDDPRQGSA